MPDYFDQRVFEPAFELFPSFEYKDYNLTLISGISIDGKDNLTEVRKYRLCGIPGFCGIDSIETCSNISISKCSDCSVVGSTILISIVLLLALVIVLGNGLVFFVHYQRRKKSETSKNEIIKVSMAVADIINGLLIFSVTLPNYLWTINSSFDSLTSAVVELHNSSQAIAGGFFCLLSYTASLFHLILLGAMRLYAVKCPFNYKTLSDLKVQANLVVVWTAAAVVASFPAWFPHNYSFDVNAAIFLYFPSLAPLRSSSSLLNNDKGHNMLASPMTDMSYSLSVQESGIIPLFLLLGIPYIIMTTIAISTGIVVRNLVKSRKNYLTNNQSGPNHDSKQDIAAFKTLSIMQAGFSITLLPIGLVAVLLYTGHLTCSTYSTPFMICFYLRMSNSIVNVIVYSVREEKFRIALREIFQKCKFLQSIQSTSTNYIVMA